MIAISVAMVQVEAEAPVARIKGLRKLQPIDASVERIVQATVCLRPFRAAGPRIEVEQVGRKRVVHNYGHGGSGWSLGWGSAARVVPMALAGGVLDVAVIGCGALGITSAVMLQEAGARVTIYTRDLPAETRSARATGAWTPDSRVALTGQAGAGFAAEWETMARFSHGVYQRALHLPDRPVRYQDRFWLSDRQPDAAAARRVLEDPIGFAHYNYLLNDLYGAGEDFLPGEHPFPARYCRRTSHLQFNIAEYTRQLMDGFLAGGGRVVRREFHDPAELAGLAEGAVVHCTGYAARALFGDETLTPVRGQIAWLPAQAEVDYGLILGNLNVVSRGDGIVVQASEEAEGSGWNDANEAVDRREAWEAVRELGRIMGAMTDASSS